MIHNMVGGGSGKLFAAIAVTYPNGSVCTCSNWTKTMKAKDTSGKALFNVPVGWWTVSCTDGSRTTSKTVSITTEGQVESVTLSYWDGTLFDNGNQYSEITGGWIGVSGSNLVSSRGTAWVSNNRISVANFTTIHFNVVGYEFYGDGDNGWLGLYDVQNPSDNPVSVSHLVIGSTGEYTIDVSSLTGSYYVRGNVSAWDEYWGTQTVNKIWLT